MHQQRWEPASSTLIPAQLQFLGSLIPRPSAEPYSPLFQPHCTLGLTPWLPGKWQGGTEPKVTAPRKAAKAALSPEASGKKIHRGGEPSNCPCEMLNSLHYVSGHLSKVLFLKPS